MSLSDRLFCNHHAHPLRQAWSYRLRCAKEVFVWFKSRLNPWYISIPSNPNLYSITIIMKMRWQTIASSVSMRTISPTATPLPTAYDCVAVYIAGRRINLVVYGCRPQPTTKKRLRIWQIATLLVFWLFLSGQAANTSGCEFSPISVGNHPIQQTNEA